MMKEDRDIDKAKNYLLAFDNTTKKRNKIVKKESKLTKSTKIKKIKHDST